MYFSASEAIWYANAESAFRADVMNKRVEEFGKDYELNLDMDKVMLSFIDLGATE
jgi:hypothetical protein